MRRDENRRRNGIRAAIAHAHYGRIVEVCTTRRCLIYNSLVVCLITIFDHLWVGGTLA